MLTPTGPVGQTHWSDSTANNPAPAATHSADAQLKVDIFAQLQNASDAFRTYIRDGLAQMERNAAAGRTPSSVPLATPPPAALNLSPRYGPSIPFSNGTLDAIRERMKSIQLAAAAGNPESRSRPLIQVNGNVNHPPISEGHGSGNPVQGGILPMDEKALSGLQARMERLKSGSFDSL
ncbi:UNVERIFIED_CONTAM: protein MOR1 [Sesamum radiatum]|uniref:Protein MOR1 n=1 Tax=Sesamum radiatum TaxID=300843 RepID=A0AAW2KFR5_SESRA